MKQIIIAFLVVGALLAATIMLKPTDEKCTELVREKMYREIYNVPPSQFTRGMEKTLLEVASNQSLFLVENKLFHKKIYLKYNEQLVGIGFLQQVVLTIKKEDLQNLETEDNSIYKKKNPAYDNYVSNPKDNNTVQIKKLRIELNQAESKMKQIKKTQLFITKKKQEEQIKELENVIQNLREKISDLEKS